MPSTLPWNFGALLIGTWLNAGLYVVELQQAWYLFTHYKDTFALRMAALLALLSDTIGTVGGFAAVFLYFNIQGGNGQYLPGQWWPTYLYIITNGITAGIVQAFLIYRFWAFSNNYIITIALGTTALTAFVCSIVSAVWLIFFVTLKQRYATVPAMTWFISSAVSDVAVAIALVWQLQGKKTGFKSTQRLICHFSAVAIKSGSVCAAMVLILMGFFIDNPQSLFAISIAFCWGRVYSLTMFYSLTTRKHGLRLRNIDDTHTTGDLSDDAIDLSRIRIGRSVRIDHDTQGTLQAIEDEHKIHEGAYYAANKPAPLAQV